MNAYLYDEKQFVLPISPEAEENAFNSSAAEKLLEELKNTGFEVVIADTGARGSDPATYFSGNSLMTVTVAPADTAAVEEIQSLTPADNEYILYQYERFKKRTCNADD